MGENAFNGLRGKIEKTDHSIDRWDDGHLAISLRDGRVGDEALYSLQRKDKPMNRKIIAFTKAMTRVCVRWSDVTVNNDSDLRRGILSCKR